MRRMSLGAAVRDDFKHARVYWIAENRSLPLSGLWRIVGHQRNTMELEAWPNGSAGLSMPAYFMEWEA